MDVAPGTYIKRLSAREPLAQMVDSLTLAPGWQFFADSMQRVQLPDSLFTVFNNFVRVDTAGLRPLCPECDSVWIVYQTLPYNLGAPFQRLDTAALRAASRDDAIEFDYSPYEPSVPLLGASTLTSNGAYTRGLSFGNSQNLVFNSNLNLQLDGKLGDDLELRAAISDNSIPLQPDGTTRQLQEFDRIFIQLKRKNTALTAGDFDLTRPTGYFSNYFKRLQGAMVTIEPRTTELHGATQNPTTELHGVARSNPKLKTQNSKLSAAAALSRGKFARQLIQGVEGNQGPYRLLGAEGERFIIVLAGTEKVFADGVLLRRGLDDDYTIDYNLGEVTFTQRRLVTKDVRIIVEFEYAVQAYLRSTVAANTEWPIPRGRVWLNLYHEQDGRSPAGGQGLDEADRQRLALAGDNLRTAFASGVDTLSEAFDPGRVLYKSVDTILCGQGQSVLIWSTNPDSARYTARFSEVAQGQGNYVQALTAANGRVFRWVGPDPLTCRPQGNFEPVVRLLAPESRQLHAAGAEWQPFRQTRLTGEIALSGRDLNRFSPIGDGDNYGLAGFARWEQGFSGRDTLRGWSGQAQASVEQTAPAFLPLNPYRPAEFARDWNTDQDAETTAERWLRGGFGLQKKGLGRLRYELGAFNRQTRYDGTRHLANLNVQRRGFDALLEINILQTNSVFERTVFERPKFDFSKTFYAKKSGPPRFKIGVYGERERNRRNATGADTLNRLSFWYDMTRAYAQMPAGTGRWQWGVSAVQRKDYAPAAADFRGTTLANEWNVQGAWESAIAAKAAKIRQSLMWNMTLRSLRILDAKLTTQTPSNTYLGRVDYQFSGWKNAVSVTTGYEVGSGQSPRIEFNYLRVNPGEGQYSWFDRNRDSILQIDEMEIAVFNDQASYVRVAVSTPNYIRTNNVTLNQNLRIEPRLLWAQSKKKWQKRLSRLSTQSTLQINRRVFAGAQGISPWNPFDLAIADTALVAATATIRNVLFVNRANPVWDISVAQADSRSRLALSTGYESRQNADWTLHTRVNFGQQWNLETDGILGHKTSENQAFASRNFDIAQREISPKISWVPHRSLRVTAEARWIDSRNQLPGAETARQTNWTAGLNWNPQPKSGQGGFRAATALRVQGTWADVNFTGQPNSAVGFAMLEGLQNGRNFLWSANLDRQLSKTLQLSLNYEGRRTGSNGRLVHLGRAQVRAVF